MIGALCSGSEHDAPPKHGLDLTLGYRYQESFRHFVGTVEQVQRERLHNQIKNTYHLMDVSVAYRLNRKWTLTGSVPVLVARRNQLYAPRAVYDVASVGDITAGFRYSLVSGEAGGLAIGSSLKFPTGDDSVDGHAIAANGQPILANADQSIQAGDGGWGFTLETQAYHRAPFSTMLYFSGSYLFNPRETNGVATFRTRRGEEVMSVSDQYLYRGGISRAIPKLRRLVASFGGRIEGVPVRDALGGSYGFRRPGYAISLDPGLMYAANQRWTMSFNMPWAVERNRRRSVADIANGTHGDAAFADYAVLFSFTRHF